MARIFLVTAISVLVYMTGWFIAAQLRGRNDIADVAWGGGFIWATAVSLFNGGT
jgi:steroid 5-alpha reductase family enzyme